MLTRTRREMVTFKTPFWLEHAGECWPAGSYEIRTSEELIEGLSFPAYRRVATTMLVPSGASLRAEEMITIEPAALAAARERDAAEPGATETTSSQSTPLPMDNSKGA